MAKSDLRQRADALLTVRDKKWKVFHHEYFEKKDKVKEILADMPDQEKFEAKRRDISKLRNQKVPAEMLPFYAEPLLDRNQEFHLFRQMNYLKWKILKEVEPLVKRASLSRVRRIEELLKRKEGVKHQLICSNTRLAAQILKRSSDFYRQHSLDGDLLSEAYLNIVRAVECFDWRKGFKFSTYATWVLLNNFSRDSAGHRRFTEQFMTGFDDSVYDARLDDKDEQIRRRDDDVESAKINVEKLLECLDDGEDERKKVIIKDWFGLFGKRKRTLEEISKDLGLTKERVRQLREKGLAKIRDKLAHGEVQVDL